MYGDWDVGHIDISDSEVIYHPWECPKVYGTLIGKWLGEGFQSTLNHVAVVF